MISPMGSKRPGGKGLTWRYGFALFCLAYAAWVIFLGLDNFAKVHGEYRRARENQQPARLEEIARHELVDQCRGAARRGGRSRAAGVAVPAGSEEDCLSVPESVLAERKKEVAGSLRAEEKLFRRKLVTFYLSFAIFFIALPLGFLYLLLTFLSWLFRDMKFVKAAKK